MKLIFERENGEHVALTPATGGELPMRDLDPLTHRELAALQGMLMQTQQTAGAYSLALAFGTLSPTISEEAMAASRTPSTGVGACDSHTGTVHAVMDGPDGEGVPIQTVVPDYVHPEPDPGDVQKWLDEHANADEPDIQTVENPVLATTPGGDTSVIEKNLKDADLFEG